VRIAAFHRRMDIVSYRRPGSRIYSEPEQQFFDGGRTLPTLKEHGLLHFAEGAQEKENSSACWRRRPPGIYNVFKRSSSGFARGIHHFADDRMRPYLSEAFRAIN